MARMAFAAARPCFRPEFAAQQLSLVAKQSEPAPPAWSIDEMPMGSGWHDSSWMLKTGLDVIEGAPAEAIPPEWMLGWWIASQAPLAAHLS